MKTGIGTNECMKSAPSLINHIPSVDANDPAISSDSIEDLAMQVCFFEAHESGELLNVKIQPVVDMQWLTSPAKSASVNPARL